MSSVLKVELSKQLFIFENNFWPANPYPLDQERNLNIYVMSRRRPRLSERLVHAQFVGNKAKGQFLKRR